MGSPGNQPTTIVSSFYFFIINGILLLDGTAAAEPLGMTVIKMVIHVALTAIGAICWYVGKNFCNDYYNIKIKPKIFKNGSEKSDTEKRA